MRMRRGEGYKCIFVWVYICVFVCVWLFSYTIVANHVVFPTPHSVSDTVSMDLYSFVLLSFQWSLVGETTFCGRIRLWELNYNYHLNELQLHENMVFGNMIVITKNKGKKCWMWLPHGEWESGVRKGTIYGKIFNNNLTVNIVFKLYFSRKYWEHFFLENYISWEQ